MVAKAKAPAVAEPAKVKKVKVRVPTYVVTKRVVPKAPYKGGRMNNRNKMIRNVIREVAGFAPYEKRVMELIKAGSAATMKRAFKFAKKRLGSHARGKNKREELIQIIADQRRRAH